MTADWTKIKIADGTGMRVYFAHTDQPKNDLFAGSSKRPTLLVLQEAFGVNSHMQNMVRRFADLGFFAACPELYHRTGEGFTAPYTDIAACMPHMKAMTEAGQTHDFKAVAGWLGEQKQADSSRMSAIGYCMGGRSAFLANATLKLKCAISYYGGGVLPALESKFSSLSGPTLFFWGGKDAHIPKEQIGGIIDHMKKAGKPYTNVEISDPDHGFNCDERPSFNKEASVQALALVKQYFLDFV